MFTYSYNTPVETRYAAKGALEINIQVREQEKKLALMAALENQECAGKEIDCQNGFSLAALFAGLRPASRQARA